MTTLDGGRELIGGNRELSRAPGDAGLAGFVGPALSRERHPYLMRRRDFLALASIGVPLGSALPFSPVAAAGLDKGNVIGLLAREQDKVDEGAALLKGFVVRLNWDAAQPAEGGAISKAACDQLTGAVAFAREHGYSRLKLRLVAGQSAPGWAKAIGGTALDWDNDGKTLTVPRWWTGAYLDAYRGFVLRLRDHLDDPMWCEVTVSATCTVFAEPCIHELDSQANRTTLLKLGYTTQDEMDALKRAIAIHEELLSPYGISSSVAYNPLQTIVVSPDGTTNSLVNDTGKTIELMDHQRAAMGDFGVWENNSLIAADIDGTLEQTRPAYRTMYAHMRAGAAAGHPVQFQTATLAKIQEAKGSVYHTALWAARNGGISVELPVGWEGDGLHGPVIDAALADKLNKTFAENA
ncbi:hypothetical protein [Winogradskya humida]|uniref:hypothetical protein n=1 Tax=Winogradskya humida TaxID=113566 RepID=UPI0019449E95|nr:hypothetical protein [Actinoplanes humidus]